jgi:hypothetical protein
MIASKQNNLKRLDREAVEEVAKAFEDIESCFDEMGFSDPGSVSAQEQPLFKKPEEDQKQQEAEQEPEDGDESFEAEVFQREDVEVAIDLFLSHLIREKVIKKDKRGMRLTLESAFETIFGDNHEIIRLVKEFDEHIEGYFDVIGADDMRSAYEEVLAIRRIINKEIKQYAAN